MPDKGEGWYCHPAKAAAVHIRSGFRCSGCSYEDHTKLGAGLTVEHLISRSQGGPEQGGLHEPATNLTTLCNKCNATKNRLTAAQYNAKLRTEGKPPWNLAEIRKVSARAVDIEAGKKVVEQAKAYRKANGIKGGHWKPVDEPAGSGPKPEASGPKGSGAGPQAGPGIHHGPDGKFEPGGGAASRPRRIGFAVLRRGASAFTADNIPTAFRILAAGSNATDKGPLVFTPESARSVMASYQDRGNPLAIYYEHEDQLPLEKRGGAPMKGACSAPSSELTIRGSASAPECWAEQVAWTDEAKRQIKSGERRQISPVAAFDKDTREVIEIINVSLCSEGATHYGTLLASRGQGGPDSMDEIIDQIMTALQAGDFESAESLVQQAEAMAGDDPAMGRMAKMARAAMAAKPPAAAPPPPPKAPPVAPPAAAARMAASRGAREQLLAAGIDVDAFTRAQASMEAATARADAAALDSRRQTVTLALSAARGEGLLGPDGDPVTEREHVQAADPAMTTRFLAHLRRQVKVGILTLSKPGDATAGAEARPGGKKPATPNKRELTAGERKIFESFNRDKDPKFYITEEEYLATQVRQGLGSKAEVGKA